MLLSGYLEPTNQFKLFMGVIENIKLDP